MPPSLDRIDHIHVQVADRARAERWYAEVLGLTNDERAAVRQTLEQMVRERAGDSGAATLSNPVRIGIGTK